MFSTTNPHAVIARAVGLTASACLLALSPIAASPSTAAQTSHPAVSASAVDQYPAAAKKTVTRHVKTYFCDTSKPVRTTTVTVSGKKVTATAAGVSFAGTRKAGHASVDLWRKPSDGFPYPQLEVTFASGTSKKAVQAQHLC